MREDGGCESRCVHSCAHSQSLLLLRLYPLHGSQSPVIILLIRQNFLLVPLYHLKTHLIPKRLLQLLKVHGLFPGTSISKCIQRLDKLDIPLTASSSSLMSVYRNPLSLCDQKTLPIPGPSSIDIFCNSATVKFVCDHPSRSTDKHSNKPTMPSKVIC